MAATENNDTKITPEQVGMVYNELEKDNKDAERLKAAQEETENTEYAGVEPMSNITDVSVTGVDNTQVNEEKADYLEAFAPYNIGDEDAVKLLNLIYDYKAGKVDHAFLYNRLPSDMQKIADGLRTSPDAMGHKISKNSAAEFLINSFINDAKLNKAVDEFTTEMDETIKGMNKEYDLIYSDAIEDIFNDIDKIRQEDPERADRILAIKNAFAESMTYQRQLDYIDTLNTKRLNKYHGGKRLRNDVYYFNKRVNVTEIKIPDIGELPEIIKARLPEYDMDVIEKFVSIIVKTTTNLQLEGEENLSNLAYVYRTVDNIYDFKFSSDPESERYNTIFGNIAKALDKINNLL
jgi:hypothetical protein